MKIFWYGVCNINEVHLLLQYHIPFLVSKWAVQYSNSFIWNVNESENEKLYIGEIPRILRIKEGFKQVNSKLINVQFQDVIKLSNFSKNKSRRPKTCGTYIFFLFLKKTYHHRNWHNKKLSKSAKLQFWDAKLDQNTNFTKIVICQMALLKIF